MNRIWRHNLLLAATAAALALWLWLDRPPAPPPPPAPLLQLEPEDVGRIEIGGPEGLLAIELERQNDGWRLVRPVQAPADAFAVNRLLELPARPMQRRLQAGALNLAEAGLDPPLWTLRYDGQPLEIGATEPVSGRRYVRTRDAIALVDDIDPALLDPNYADLVSRQLISRPVSSVTLPGAETPTTEAALTEHWQNAKALWVIRPDARDHDAAGARVMVTLKDESIEFRLRRREPQLELIRPDLDLLYVLPGSAAGELLPAR